jgi:hypothetical protein
VRRRHCVADVDGAAVGRVDQRRALRSGEPAAIGVVAAGASHWRPAGRWGAGLRGLGLVMMRRAPFTGAVPGPLGLRDHLPVPPCPPAHLPTGPRPPAPPPAPGPRHRPPRGRRARVGLAPRAAPERPPPPPVAPCQSVPHAVLRPHPQTLPCTHLAPGRRSRRPRPRPRPPRNVPMGRAAPGRGRRRAAGPATHTATGSPAPKSRGQRAVPSGERIRGAATPTRGAASAAPFTSGPPTSLRTKRAVLQPDSGPWTAGIARAVRGPLGTARTAGFTRAVSGLARATQPHCCCNPTLFSTRAHRESGAARIS